MAAAIPSIRPARFIPLLALLGILLAAALLRVPGLDRVPPGLWFDEALDGQDAAAVWGPGGHFRLVYPDVFPREAIYTSLLAVAIKLAGPEVVTLRLVSVSIGLLTVLLLYLMLRGEAGEGAALAGAGVLATLRWHAIFSRLVFRTILLGPWLICIAWAALSLRRRPHWAKALALGVLAGGGFYTYLTWYFMLPWVGGVLLWIAWQARAGRMAWKLVGLVALAGTVTFAPLGIHYLRVPADLLARPQAVSPFIHGVGAGLRDIAKNTLDCALMFFWRGDHVPKHNIPLEADPAPPPAPGHPQYGWPALDKIQAVCFATGVVLCVLFILRGRRAKNDPNAATQPIMSPTLPLLLLGWIGCALLATIFTHTDSPNTLRTLCATPAVAAVAGIGLYGAVQQLLRAHSPALRGLVAALLIAGSGVLSARAIYSIWPARMDVWQSYNGDEYQLAQFARNAPADTAVYVPQFLYDHRAFQFQLLGRPDAAQRIVPYRDFSFLAPWNGAKNGNSPAPRVRWIIGTWHNQVHEVVAQAVPGAKMLHPFTAPAGNTWAVTMSINEKELPPPAALKALQDSWLAQRPPRGGAGAETDENEPGHELESLLGF